MASLARLGRVPPTASGGSEIVVYRIQWPPAVFRSAIRAGGLSRLWPRDGGSAEAVVEGEPRSLAASADVQPGVAVVEPVELRSHCFVRGVAPAGVQR